MIKFSSLEFLELSHRIPGKVENAVYSFETSGLVAEIKFKVENFVKYANKRTDDVIYSTQYNIKYHGHNSKEYFNQSEAGRSS